MRRNMEKIEGSPKNLRQLLQNTKYSIPFYQREYMWQREHIEALINDLTSEFKLNYQPEDSRLAVAGYGSYFMGSIVLTKNEKASVDGHENAIIDGQQRLTSLTLLLMYLNNRLKNTDQSNDMLENMIFSEAFGVKSFNLNVDDRQECMEAIFNAKDMGKDFDTTGCGESEGNIYGRYNDIVELFPEDITDEMLLHFCDWLLEKVCFIEIVAKTEPDAHQIFVSMNDRGLKLTTTDLLKAYLLSNIENHDDRKKLNDSWKKAIFELKKSFKTYHKDYDPDYDTIDEDFFQDWLCAQYAENKQDSVSNDFEQIGSSFYKWVFDESVRLGLNSSSDFKLFIKKFKKFAGIYQDILKADYSFAKETEYLYYIDKLDPNIECFWRAQVLLAPICYDDKQEVITEKLNLTARFIELLMVSRITNYKRTTDDEIIDYINNLTIDIRRCDVPTLKQKLMQHYNDLEFDPDSVIPDFQLKKHNKNYVKHMLARVTSFIEESIGRKSHYDEYIDGSADDPFEIEHIICDHYDWFADDYDDKGDFDNHRNSIGALLLLHKSTNASLSDADYAEKLKDYSSSGNIYAASLGRSIYNHNPRFNKFIAAHDLNFKSFRVFGKNQIKERIKLFTQLTKLIWNGDMFE